MEYIIGILFNQLASKNYLNKTFHLIGPTSTCALFKIVTYRTASIKLNHSNNRR